MHLCFSRAGGQGYMTTARGNLEHQGSKGMKRGKKNAVAGSRSRRTSELTWRGDQQELRLRTKL
jgi:hypothetical protein